MGKQLEVNPLFFSLDKSQCVGWIKAQESRLPIGWRISAGFLSLCFAGRGSASLKWRPAPAPRAPLSRTHAVRTRGERRPLTSFPSLPIDPPSTAARAPPSRRPRARPPTSTPRPLVCEALGALFPRIFARADRSPPRRATHPLTDATPARSIRTGPQSHRADVRHGIRRDARRQGGLQPPQAH